MNLNKIGVISLGCDKNRVDTENMLSFLSKEGFEFTSEPKDADIIIVNTCAFIESAKREAIDTILEMSELKAGKCKCLVVTGCLPQRYMQEIKDELSEVDIYLGTGSYKDLPKILKDFNGVRVFKENDRDKRDFVSERILTTPYHYAYLKIAEGCDNKCTYCAIPKIRGKYTSRPAEELVAETEELIKNYGIKELIIVAQDITRYGIDIYNKYSLIDLLNSLSLTAVEWIRLLYCYPELVTDELLTYISVNAKVVKYIDIPMQHASTDILKRMNRHVTHDDLVNLVAKIKRYNIAIRTTFIVGFPGETEEDYQILYDFVKNCEFDKCGFFAYSPEDGTPAMLLKDHLDENIKEERVKKLYDLQHKIMVKKAKNMKGQTCKVIYEGIDYDKQSFYGRTSKDAPDIDGIVYFHSKKALDIGNIYEVLIVNNDDFDLIGEIK